MTGARRINSADQPAESARLEALRRYRIIDTPPEQQYDDITRIAAAICGAPISLVTLLDESRQWFKSRFGLDLPHTSRQIAFCDRAIRGNVFFEVTDASDDPRFQDNPLVTGPPGIRYYGGVPLTTPDGYNLGTLCVIDRVPRRLTDQQREALEALARQVVTQMELRRKTAESERLSESLSGEIARRAAVEEALSRAEAFVSGAVDALTYHVAIVDRDGRIVRTNAAWTRFAEANAAPAVAATVGRGADYLRVCAAASGEPPAAEVAQALRAALAGRECDDAMFEYPCHGPAAQRWFSARISSFTNDEQRFALISHQDITQRKLAEQEVQALNDTLEARVRERSAELERTYALLSAAERKFHSTFEHASVGLTLLDRRGCVSQANAVFAEMVGRRPPALAGVALAELVRAGDGGRFEDSFARLMDGAMPGFVEELVLSRPDGTRLWCHASVAAVHEVRDDDVAAVALVQDMTLQRHIAREFDLFFNLSADMFVIGGCDGRMLRANPACIRVLGFPPAELYAMPYLELVHPDDRQSTAARLQALIQSPATSSIYFDVRMRTRAGPYRDVHWSVAAWRDAHRLVAVGTDITEVRTAERQQRALASRLQTIREEERTLISQEIHDELGQMLTALKMDVTLLKRDLRAGGPAGQRDSTAGDVDGIEKLIDSTLRSVKRIAWQLRPEVLDSLGLTAALRWLLDEVSARSDVSLELHAAEEISVRNDRCRTALYRIVQESLTNVVRHAGASVARVEVLADAASLTLSVSDDGRGFDPLDGVTRSLGILGMRERADSIGASLVVDSRPGAGTTVTVSVPAAVALLDGDDA